MTRYFILLTQGQSQGSVQDGEDVSLGLSCKVIGMTCSHHTGNSGGLLPFGNSFGRWYKPRTVYHTLLPRNGSML